MARKKQAKPKQDKTETKEVGCLKEIIETQKEEKTAKQKAVYVKIGQFYIERH